MHTLQGRDYDQSVVVQDAKKKQKSMLYLFLFKRTAKIEVKKFNSRRAVPVVVLNKQSLRGDNDGCCNTMRTSSLKNKRTPKKMLYKNSCQIASELKQINLTSTCSPAPTIARRLELYSISTILKAPTATKTIKQKTYHSFVSRDSTRTISS